MNVILLPGIIAPAHLRYAPLLAHLPDVHAVPKELEVYAGPEPPDGYSIELEIRGVDRAAAAAGFDRFHLYGHSAGGAVALAYAAAQPERVLSLAVDEPASDFGTPDPRDAERAKLEDEAALLPEPESTRRFLSLQLAPGTDLPEPPAGPTPPWMAKRPAGLRAFIPVLREYHVPPESYTAFDRPVYYSYGSLSDERWVRIKDRLAAVFPDFTAECYEGLHHLNTSHQAEPGRVARRLLDLWGHAEFHG